MERCLLILAAKSLPFDEAGRLLAVRRRESAQQLAERADCPSGHHVDRGRACSCVWSILQQRDASSAQSRAFDKRAMPHWGMERSKSDSRRERPGHRTARLVAERTAQLRTAPFLKREV